ncbi:MAG: hypothetical protein OXG27_07495 [Chloroflexi bacterium]|nr:hypothetical protein [Chloroflexota bacterium]
MAVVSLAGLLLGGATAGAQTSTTLASNFSKANGKTFGFGHEYGQSFTTRSNASGYKLTQLKLDVDVKAPNGKQPTYKVELWSLKNSAPASKLTTLTNPSAITDGVNTWTFPGSGYDVKADTTYVVLWDVFDPVGSINAAFATTADNAEDSGSWPIGNTSFMKTKSAKSWGTDSTDSLQIKILGYAKPTPTADPVQAPPPDPPNLARGAIQPTGPGVAGAPVVASPRQGISAAVSGATEERVPTGMHPVPVRMREISSNKPRHASGSLDLRRIAASVSEDLRRYSRGFYLTVMVERVGGQRHLFRAGSALDRDRQAYELARGAPLVKVHIWHVYHHRGRGVNTVELLGEIFIGRAGDRLVEPVEICLPAPERDVDRATIAARGRLDRYWTILESYLTFDGQICADTVRVSWFTIVLEPESEHRAA